MAANEDVAYSADGSTDGVQNNGAIIVAVTRTGNYKVVAPEINAHLSSGSLYNKYTNRFDDVNYYFGG
jgi:hypothetical protein